MSFPPHEHTYREGEREVMCMKTCEDWLRWVSSRNDESNSLTLRRVTVISSFV